jgi:hypothetical protein
MYVQKEPVKSLSVSFLRNAFVACQLVRICRIGYVDLANLMNGITAVVA